MRVVFDTNIFISALAITGGSAEEAYLLAVRGAFDLFTSVAILTDTANTLRGTFEWSDEQVQRALRAISKISTVLKTRPHLPILADEPDNRILECALLAKANYIVTGDRHLLSLSRHGGVSMLTLADFLTLIRRA